MKTALSCAMLGALLVACGEAFPRDAPKSAPRAVADSEGINPQSLPGRITACKARLQSCFDYEFAIGATTLNGKQVVDLIESTGGSTTQNCESGSNGSPVYCDDLSSGNPCLDFKNTSNPAGLCYSLCGGAFGAGGPNQGSCD